MNSNFEFIDEFGVDFEYDYLNDVCNHTLEKLKVKNAFFDVIFIDDEHMHEMNKEYRGIDRTTDVLSFALEDNDNIKGEIRELGDIFDKDPAKERAFPPSINCLISPPLCVLTLKSDEFVGSCSRKSIVLIILLSIISYEIFPLFSTLLNLPKKLTAPQATFNDDKAT